jgi:phosphomannomutase/phosphoglucomutase
MKINPFIFRDYDIRGVAGEDLDAEKVESIGKAYGTLLAKRKITKAVVGMDCRLSGPKYKKAIIKGLTETGIDVIDLGQVMTQMVYFAQYRYKSKGCVMVSASHNPSKFNGFKMGVDYSRTTEKEDVMEVKEIVEKEDYFKSDKKGNITKKDVSEDYFKDIQDRISICKKFKIVVDFRYGTPGLYVSELLKRMGCEVISFRDKPDGSFPGGTPDPTEEEFLIELGKKVVENKADIGFAFDADGDRLGVVDEKGRIQWNDVVVAIFAKDILEKNPKSKIVYNTLCTQIVKNVVEENKGIPIMWRTGHAFIKKKMGEENAIFGGELSGHFFFKDDARGYDDGSYAAVRVLKYLCDKDISLAQLIDTFPKYISSPEIKIGCPDDKKIDVVKDISKRFKSDFPKGEINDDSVIPGNDGVRIDFKDGMIVFRYSQNGPYITVKFEAKDQKTYDERKRYVREMLESYPDMIWKAELSVNLDSLKD